jgi:GNAT superfamily N-acetyltransferase
MHSEVTIRPLGEPGDLGWVVKAHGELYFQEFGWDSTFEALVARIVAEYAACPESDRQAAWVAMMNGRRVGCVFCCTKDDGTAQLRLLLTDPGARGKGVGSELVRRCVDFALQAGYEQMVLWTQDVLVAAARIYLAAGFILVEEEPHHSFGTDLVGQVYELELTASAPGANEPWHSGRGRSTRRVGAFRHEVLAKAGNDQHAKEDSDVRDPATESRCRLRRLRTSTRTV